MYSNYCAFSTEKKQFLKQFVLSSSSPSSDLKFGSTDINPVTPPTFSLLKACKTFRIPLGDGFVPTSRRIQIYGLNCLQKP